MKDFASQVNFYQRAFTAPLINAHNQLREMFAEMATKEEQFVPYVPGMLDVGNLEILDISRDGSVGPLSQRMAAPLTHENVASRLQTETSHLGSQIFELWSRYMVQVGQNMSVVHPLLQHEREARQTRLWNESIFRETLPIEECMVPSESMGNKSEAHTTVAETLRSSEYYRNLDPLLIDDISPMNTNDTQPIIFEQRYLRQEEPAGPEAAPGAEPGRPMGATPDRPHLIVFVHGFLGNSYDLRLMRNHLAILFPHFDFFMSTANEEATLDSIEDMGHNLAEEVRNHIVSKHLAIERISFMGFSLGSVIIRSALTDPALRPYIPYLYTYLSLSGPHCGFLFNPSFVVDSGMWVMKNWKKSKSLQQLSLGDHPDKRDTYIYQLSQQPGLSHFKHVLLLSSMQDRYVPSHSARIEMCAAALGAANDDSDVYYSMVRGLLEPLMHSDTLLLRIDVSFGIKKMNLDSAIGRTAHILFLESAPFLRMFVHLYGGYLA